MNFRQWTCLALVGTTLVTAPGCVVYPERPVAVRITEAPPAAVVERVPAAPGPDYVWQSGYWTWQGRWVWAPGAWVVRPHRRAAWVPGHWVHARHGWVWIAGGWR